MFAFFVGNGISISCSVLFIYLLQQRNYFGIWIHLIIAIVVYLFANSFIHFLLNLYCKSYISGSNPKHLIIVSTGHCGHYSLGKHFQNSFKHQFERNNLNDQSNIIVHLAKNNHNGLFFYSIVKTNDGINKGGMRLANEIKSLLIKYPSVNKLSFIGFSLGGIYCRHSLSLLFDDSQSKTPRINGNKYELINFITVATPHQGITDSSSKQVKLARYIACLLPLTIQQLLLIDKPKLLIQMATDDKYLRLLKLFKNAMCYGNAKYDSLVSLKSALILKDNTQINNAENVWDKMVHLDKNHHIEEFKDHIIHKKECNEDNEFLKLTNDIKWKKFVVCWNQHLITRNFSHVMSTGLPFRCSFTNDLWQNLHKNFLYSSNATNDGN